ncbi:MAG: replication-associated recombination protein A, partial [Alphaproteobacteria bacterium]|nr:replication-associated recombination protein A [Alphaproteobacteria bacterium]
MKKPLAELLRPTDISDLVGENLRKLNLKQIQSMILWGPPGCGKTSFAKIIASKCGLEVVTMSAVTSGSTQFKQVFEIAERGNKLLLHVDEIHHLNKSQQDIFLPHLENGNITLIGTTTENPSFELRPALLSRCKVIVFKRLSVDDLETIIGRAEKYLERTIPLDTNARKLLCELADGDGRYLLNMVEELISMSHSGDTITADQLTELLSKRTVIYDKNSDEHYNLISALHKSLRGSDVNAALYWFSRMIAGGENPLYIARRLVRFAVEDVGLADPNALQQAIAAQQAYSFLGSPEGELAICQAVIYLATAPKSNAGYVAFNSARRLAEKTGSLMPPKHILNAPTKFMKEQGYSNGYVYDPDTPNGFSGQNYFPEGIARQNLYNPVERG